MDDELCWRPIRELSGLIRDRRISVSELVGEHLARIERANPSVNAIVTMDPDRSLREASAADAAIARGDALGPLHGIPAAFKDTHDTAGMRTTQGSPLFADRIPATDDLVIDRMRRAGAITLGKTNVPEFAAGSNTFNALFGATRNPYDLTRTSGGSTGGSAAALITGMAAACEGSDLGGSLRTPASFCNVVGLRPTPGRVPDVPTQFGWQTLNVRGPIGRTVDDVALVLSVISGPDPRNPLALEQDGAAFAELTPADLRGLRVAWSPDLGGRVDVDRGVIAVLEQQLGVLEALGCRIEEACIDLDGADSAFRTLRSWMFNYAMREHYRDRRDQLKPSLIWNIEEGRDLTGSDVAAAVETQTTVFHNARTFFETHDLLALPAAQTLPYPVDDEFPTVIGGNPATTYLDCLRLAYSISMTGCPAMSVPAGFSAAGLPVGLQLVGPHRQEHRLLSIARAYEEATAFGRRLPDMAAMVGPPGGAAP
jgi:amidase